MPCSHNLVKVVYDAECLELLRPRLNNGEPTFGPAAWSHVQSCAMLSPAYNWTQGEIIILLLHHSHSLLRSDCWLACNKIEAGSTRRACPGTCTSP